MLKKILSEERVAADKFPRRVQVRKETLLRWDRHSRVRTMAPAGAEIRFLRRKGRAYEVQVSNHYLSAQPGGRAWMAWSQEESLYQREADGDILRWQPTDSVVEITAATLLDVFGLLPE